MLKKVLAGVASAALVVSMAQAAEAAPSPILDVEDSAAMEGESIAEGRVVDKTGKSYGKKLRVNLYLWPSDDVSSSLELGDALKVIPVAKAWTNTDGTFSLKLDRNLEISRSVGGDDYMDLEAVVETPDGRAPHSFSVSTAQIEEYERGNSGKFKQALNLRLTPIEAGEQPARVKDADEVLVEEYGDYTNKLSCEWVLTRDLGNREVAVGSGYMTASGITNQFVFESGASTTMGVAFSGTSAYGGFSQSGTTTKTASGTQIYPKQTGEMNNRIYETYFRWGVFRERCQTSTVDWFWSNNWESRPNGWAAGAPTSYVNSAPTATFCTSMPMGAEFRKVSGKAATWSSGVQVAGDIGINLSSQSGWTSVVESRWTFQLNRKLCGTNGSIGGTSNTLRLVGKA